MTCVAHKIHREAKQIIDSIHDIHYLINSGKKFLNSPYSIQLCIKFVLFVNTPRAKYIRVHNYIIYYNV